MIAKVATDALRLDQKKPLQTTHRFEQSFDATREQVQLNSSNYKNRIRSDRVSRLAHSTIFLFTFLLCSLSEWRSLAKEGPTQPLVSWEK